MGGNVMRRLYGIGMILSQVVCLESLLTARQGNESSGCSRAS
jgi:hypothetical protein